MKFKNRVFGCAIVKAINSNYNADFQVSEHCLVE